MFQIRILLLILLFSCNLSDRPKENPAFISPLKIPVSLSANFGELRYDHFHSGIDIKTQGVTGKEIIATSPGYVYRISVSPGGFGKAIYLRHPSGYSTVYGHIDRFIPEIEEYVSDRQYEEKSFMVTLWPPKDKFAFEKGDLIAYSGNSGSSSGPHLHYEVRRSDDENPVNPLAFGHISEDNEKPVIEKLVIYNTGRKTLINNQPEPYRINVSGGDGIYRLNLRDPVTISGSAGFGIKAFDLSSNSSNRSSVYSITLRIDDRQIFGYVMDSFSFSDSRYINSHIDYEALMRDNEYIERAFVLPNDKLRVYNNVVNRGIFDFSDGRQHEIKITVSDINNNSSELTFYAKSVPADFSGQPIPENTVVMPYGRNNRFISKDIIVNIPSGTLYDTLFFEFKRTPGNDSMYSDIYQVHNIFTPLHRAYSLSIKPGTIPAGKRSKMLLVCLAENKTRIPLITKWEDGYLTAKPIEFGSFYAGIDTVPPVISANGFTDGADLSGKEEIRIRITDDFSGIRSYEPVIDGKWALFEYDLKNNTITYRFDSKRITRGTKHYLTLKVTDNKENMQFLSREFKW